MKKINAILPIRRNSKRLKNKNFLKIKKKPLFSFILQKLINISSINKIILSTDVPCKLFGKLDKKIIFLERPCYLSNNCNMNKVINHVIKHYPYENYIQLHATSPLIKEKTINKAINNFLSQSNFDSLFSVTKKKKRLWSHKNNPINHKLSSSPTTQNLKPYFEENSAFYIFSHKSFIKYKNRIGKKIKMMEISELESIDIDYKEEFEIVKKIIESEK